MKYVATILQPSSVVDSLCAKLIGGEEEYLVVAKSTYLEIYAVLTDAITLQCKHDIWGKILSVSLLPVKGTESHIMVMTDHPNPQVLVFNFEGPTRDLKPKLNCIDVLSVHDRNARPAEFCNRCLVDRKGRTAVVNMYVGKIKVLELDEGKIKSSFDVA